jgi:hypothetical protein
MTEKDRLIRARMVILTLAAEIKNVARACKLAHVSRSQFYAMKKAYETHGKEGLAPRVRRKPNMPNRTPPELERQILLNTRVYPTFSYLRLAQEMMSKGVAVSPMMVRYVWRRHGLSTRAIRVEWMKRWVEDRTLNTQDGHNTSIEVPHSAPGDVRLTCAMKPAKGLKSVVGERADWTSSRSVSKIP